ncbi:hypothetical protein JTB14_020440 [Gonioctena quinquepunctata]|nr:hypothetical protein JTB14_020440 [Gonioctena quinquepunctata]
MWKRITALERPNANNYQDRINVRARKKAEKEKETAASHPIKFCALAEHFIDDEKQLRRGENSNESGHMNIFDSILDPAVIKGGVDVSMDLTENKILTRNFFCPRGPDLCHHMAALLYHAHYNISSTDKVKTWGTAGVSTREEESV